ncbi:MAG: 3-hydroxyacyl-CoA dehydrogenase family protein [Deltaproteobacteria bacterium]|nr:3-hydroxyacyl-CoA dehydrogenase family protein [Deltaproteobacteria bacterium]
MEIRRVAVIGSGQMGTGVAQVAARAGFETILFKMTEGAVEAGKQKIAKTLQREVEKQRCTDVELKDTLGRLQCSNKIHDLTDCDLVIESIIENMEEKQRLFARLEDVVNEGGIFATNTSTLSVTALAEATKRPQRMIGMHFFNPAPIMKLVEIVPTLRTDAAVLGAAEAFVAKLKKTGVVVRDFTGFVVNRLLTPYMVDAIRTLQEGLGSITALDSAMQLGANHPMGPFALADFIGLDVVFHMASNLFDEYREPRLTPPPLLRRLVLAGYLGRKSGKGFYDYSTTPPTPNDWLVGTPS